MKEESEESNQQIQKDREQLKKCVEALRQQGLTDEQIQKDYGIEIDLL